MYQFVCACVCLSVLVMVCVSVCRFFCVYLCHSVLVIVCVQVAFPAAQPVENGFFCITCYLHVCVYLSLFLSLYNFNKKHFIFAVGTAIRIFIAYIVKGDYLQFNFRSLCWNILLK